MNELALFSGAGGGILGGLLCGWRTVAAVEIEDYPRAVLLQRQADGILPRFPVWDDVRTFDGNEWRGKVDIITGGFPCQDISAAGNGAGIENGERSGLWREFARIIGEVRPRYVLVENSPMLVSRGLGIVLGDLAAMGYDATWGVLGACDVGAPHKRERIWIVAYSAMHGLSSSEEQRSSSSGSNCITSEQDKAREPSGLRSARINEDVADTTSEQDFGGERGNMDETPLGREGGNSSAGTGREDVAYSDDAGLQGSIGERETEAQGKPDGHAMQCGSDEIPNSESEGLEGFRCKSGEQEELESWNDCESMDDSENEGDVWRYGCVGETEQSHDSAGGESDGSGEWWAVEPDVGRVAHGVAARVDRLKAIGNGQVPAVARMAWEILGDIES